MKKIARWKERWIRRRPDTVPPELPPEEENDSAIPPPEPCERCRVLQKDIPPFGFYTCLVTVSSLDLDCRYCQQFHNIFELANRSNKSLTGITRFNLSRKCFTFGNEQVEVSDLFYYLQIQPGIGRTETYIPYIHLFPSEIKWGSITYPLGRYMKPSSADFDMFKAVLHNCCTRHTSTCTPSAPEPSLLRLIDCRDRRINPASRNQRYICLSYVWGKQVDEIRTLDGALPDPVPKTVEDAMFVAIQLDIPFLWVDRYCIDQEKPQEKHNIIRNMDKIYHGAELTIIAAAGEDPRHGLPGVRGTPRKPHYQLNFGNDKYLVAEPGREEIAESKWSSRGWYI